MATLRFEPARLEIERSRRDPVIVFGNLPPGCGARSIIESFTDGEYRSADVRIDRDKYLQPPPFEVRSADDHSHSGRTEIRLTLGASTDLDQAVRWLEKLWGVSLLFTAQLTAPLGALIRAHVDADRPPSSMPWLRSAAPSGPMLGPPHNGVVGYRNVRLT